MVAPGRYGCFLRWRSYRPFRLDETTGCPPVLPQHHIDSGERLRTSEAGNFRRGFSARLDGDFLAVAKMAGVVMGRRARSCPAFWCPEVDPDQPLADVLHLSPDHCAARAAYSRIVLEQTVEMLEVRTATGGVGDDGVEIVELEVIEQTSGIPLGHFVFAVVSVKRSAATLRRRRDDGAAVRAKDIGGVRADVANR